MRYSIMISEILVPSIGIKDTKELEGKVERLISKGAAEPFDSVYDTESVEDMRNAWNGLKMAKIRVYGGYFIVTRYVWRISEHGEEDDILDKYDCDMD